jgi:2-keto-4-pentenoate hydratase
MATGQERKKFADELWKVRRRHGTLAPPSTRFAQFDLADGYAVGFVLSAQRMRSGDRRVGLKLGFTNTAVWEILGLAEPICAPVYDGSVRHTGDSQGDVFVDTRDFVAPAIEPEIVLGIGAGGVTWWALGLEIVHCHYPDWHMTPADALADGALHGALIVGVHVPLRPDSQTFRTPFAVELLRDGQLYEKSTTEAVLGGPLRALERAAAICAGVPEVAPPQAGELVTTGSLTSAPRILAGQSWTVRAEKDSPALTIIAR